MKHYCRFFLFVGIFLGQLFANPLPGHFQNTGANEKNSTLKIEAVGLVVKKADSVLLKKQNLTAGVEVLRVQKGSPAERAGLLPHDIIIKFDGTSIAAPLDLQRILDEIDQPEITDVEVDRQGKTLILTIQLVPPDSEYLGNKRAWRFWPWFADSFPDFTLRMAPFFREWNEKGGYLGVVVENLTDQLLRYFKADYGVLIKKVQKNSPAEKAGLKAGDVIFKINEKKIKDVVDLIRTVRYYDPGDTIAIRFIRNGQKKSTKAILAKNPAHRGWRSVFPWWWLDEEQVPRKHIKHPMLPPVHPRFYRKPQERRRDIYKF